MIASKLAGRFLEEQVIDTREQRWHAWYIVKHLLAHSS